MTLQSSTVHNTTYRLPQIPKNAVTGTINLRGIIVQYAISIACLSGDKQYVQASLARLLHCLASSWRQRNIRTSSALGTLLVSHCMAIIRDIKWTLY